MLLSRCYCMAMKYADFSWAATRPLIVVLPTDYALIKVCGLVMHSCNISFTPLKHNNFTFLLRDWRDGLSNTRSSLPCKAGRTLRRRWTQVGTEQGRETQHGKRCVTQCERILRRKQTQDREKLHGKHCVTQCERTMRSSFL